MKLRMVIRQDAADELREAKRWYDSQRIGLGRDFAAEVAQTVRAARETPERFPFVEGKVQRALLKRFPFGVFFRVRQDELVVIAVFHLRRNPAGIKGRSKQA